jgi:lipoprotein-releasing system permease protein
MLGSFGIAAGVLIGLLFCFFGNQFRLVSIPAEIYSLSFVPFRANPISVMIIIICTAAIVIVSGLFPAIKASRVRPAENLRSH